MDKNILDYLRELPAVAKFVLGLIGALGASGFFTGIFAVWKIFASAAANKQAARDAREANESKARIEKEQADQKVRHEKELAELRVRIEALELERLRAQTEAKQAEAASENMQRLIEVVAAGNERWQRVYDVKSERQLEADRLQHETNKMFIESVERNTKTVANISEMLEIQSEHLGGFGRVMQHFENKLDTTLQTVENNTRDNRSDLTTALGMGVNYRTESDTMLRSILQAVDGVRIDVKSIISQNENQKTQALLSIEAKIASIERGINALINPRPALLGVPEEKPTELVTETEEQST